MPKQAKQLKFGIDAKAKLLAGITVVNDAVAATLGPKGHNVAIDRAWGAPTVLHDGVSVAKEIELPDPFENMGAQLIKEAAQNTNDAAGDGTTTATILTHAIVTECLKNIAAGANAMMLRKGIEKAVESIVESLQAMAKPIVTNEEIKQIAMISAQDPEIGELITAAIEKLGRNCIITVEETQGDRITMEYKQGLQFDRGWLIPEFVNHQETGETILEKPYILVTDRKINDLHEFGQFLEMFGTATDKENLNLVVIADGVEGESLAVMAINKVQGKLPCVAIQAPNHAEAQKAVLQDIATMTGATFVNRDLGMMLNKLQLSDLGRAKRVVVTKKSTLIVDGMGDEKAIKDRVAELKHSLENVDLGEFDREKIQERLAKIESGIAVMNVGAKGETEMREKKERCIDAINATKSAIEEGIVPGGETALLQASLFSEDKLIKFALEKWDKDTQTGFWLVVEAVTKPFERLMTNSGYDAGRMRQKLDVELTNNISNIGIDVVDGELKNMIKAGIIDPVKVPRSALQNAASTATMIMTTNVLITDIPVEKERIVKNELYD